MISHYLSIQWDLSTIASTWTKKVSVAAFVRLSLLRIFKQGLKKLAGIQGGPVFWGSALEKFHCINITLQVFSKWHNTKWYWKAPKPQLSELSSQWRPTTLCKLKMDTFQTLHIRIFYPWINNSQLRVPIQRLKLMLK
jgi:hypothetical protein